MGLMRTGLDPRNLSGRLYYIPHTKKHVYREIYWGFGLFVGFSFVLLIKHIILTLYSQNDHTYKSKD